MGGGWRMPTYTELRTLDSNWGTNFCVHNDLLGFYVYDSSIKMLVLPTDNYDDMHYFSSTPASSSSTKILYSNINGSGASFKWGNYHKSTTMMIKF